MIRSFSDRTTAKIFRGEALTKKELRAFGGLDYEKAKVRLIQLHESTEKDLILLPSLCYHSLSGSSRYSIDANSRRSRWRITFEWDADTMVDVQLVEIEHTHS